MHSCLLFLQFPLHHPMSLLYQQQQDSLSQHSGEKLDLGIIKLLRASRLYKFCNFYIYYTMPQMSVSKTYMMFFPQVVVHTGDIIRKVFLQGGFLQRGPLL